MDFPHFFHKLLVSVIIGEGFEFFFLQTVNGPFSGSAVYPPVFIFAPHYRLPVQVAIIYELPARQEVTFYKVYSAFDFAFGLRAPCPANSRGKAERRSKVFKNGVPYGFFVFIGADYYGFSSCR